jgi:hypothetical protein
LDFGLKSKKPYPVEKGVQAGMSFSSVISVGSCLKGFFFVGRKQNEGTSFLKTSKMTFSEYIGQQ